jgi:hypothetical protein
LAEPIAEAAAIAHRAAGEGELTEWVDRGQRTAGRQRRETPVAISLAPTTRPARRGSCHHRSLYQGGAWLYSAGHPVLHLNDISQTDKRQPPDSGVIDHVAFSSRGFEAMKQHLTGKGVLYRVNQVPNSTRWQIFLRDPNNVEIELNFETKNETVAS